MLRRLVNVLILIMVSSLTMVPSAEAWTWKTHADIVDAVYYDLPLDVQHKLNLSAMRDGSNDPDEKFHDFRSHSYPSSYSEAKIWLDKGKASYDQGDYNQASYCYGVASHYISDTFSAPHTVSRESYSDHSAYEDQAKMLKPTTNYISGDLNSIMRDGYIQGEKSWNSWMLNRNTDIIQNDLNRAASTSFSAISDSINSKQESFLDYILNLFSLNISNIKSFLNLLS